ncbi:MAG: enoyl-CoA hydratase-related protein [Dehalococcoidia bacterium]|jgi:enoyl-CoA hydratase
MSNPVHQSSEISDGRVLTIPVGASAAFEDACARASTDEVVRAVVIVLAGEESSADLVEEGMPATLAALLVPVIAGLSGRIDDRALELALTADVRICETGTTFAMTTTTAGERRLPSDGGTQRLPRIVGSGLATDMLLTGRRVTAEEAMRAGLVTEICPAGESNTRARQLAKEIAAHGKSAGRFTKEAVLKGADMPLEQSLRLEADLAILLHTDPERAEGIDAFNRRRKPDFRQEDESK